MDRWAAVPPGPRRHSLTWLPVRQLGLLGGYQKSVTLERRGTERPRYLDCRRAAYDAASQPFQSRAGIGMDSPHQAQTRHPDPFAHRHRLRGTALPIAAEG